MLIFNLFFDVPVKLGAVIIPLVTLVMIAPHLRSLFDYFWLHRLSMASSRWAPPAKIPALRIMTRIIEFGFLGLTLLFFAPPTHRAAAEEATSGLSQQLL